MNSFAIVFRREVVERRNVIFTAIAASLIPILVPLLPSVPADSRIEARTFLALFVAAVFAAGVAVISGASLFSRDLAEGRSSFLFARPIGQTSIWSGKIAAGLALIFTTLAIIAVPAFLFQRTWPRGWDAPRFDAPGVLGPVLVALLLLLLGNAVGVMVRSRKLLVLADFVLATIACAAGWMLFVQFARIMPGADTVRVSAAVIALTVAAALLAGSYAQTALGRADIGRAHRALSMTTWPIVLGALAVMAAVVAWIPRVGPEDIQRAHSVASGSGPWLMVAGKASLRPNAYEAAMIVDSRNPQRYMRVAAPMWSGYVAFSRDGRRGAWTEPDVAAARTAGFRARQRLVVADLETLVARPTDVTVDRPARLALSDDGRLLALWDGKQASVFEFESMRSLGSVKVAANWLYMYFTPAGALRLFPFTEGPFMEVEKGSFDLLTWDPATREFSKDGTVPGGRRVVADATGARLLVASAEGLALHDGAHGAPIATLLARPRKEHRWTTGIHLTDGRIAISRKGDAENSLLLFAYDGTLTREIALPQAEWLAVTEQIGAETVLVRASSGQGERRSYRTMIVNLAEGRVTRVIADVIPESTWRFVETDPRAAKPRASVALWNPISGSVQRFDSATGVVTPLIGK